MTESYPTFAAKPAAEATPSLPKTLGERVRELRAAAGLTQSDIAGSRFSKEYISQIERGKTRPTVETISWLAARLGVDRAFLENGVSASERVRIEAKLARVDALIANNEYADALEMVSALRGLDLANAANDLNVRALSAEARACVYLGEVARAIEALSEARLTAENTPFSDSDRAEIVFQLGVCRVKLGSLSTARALFDEALRLAESDGLPSDVLRSQILSWRSRCHRLQRDYVAALDDVERALELAESIDDPRAVAHTYFQASLTAERQGHWIKARVYAERAKARFEEVSDRENVGRMLNNLGGLNFLLGNPTEALAHLQRAFGVAVELGNRPDAGQALSSMAHIHLHCGHSEAAHREARKALELLGGRPDTMHDVACAELIIGQALTRLGRVGEAEAYLDDAERHFEESSSLSKRAATWVAQGDLARAHGDESAAAGLYRRAAEALQDARF